MDRKLTYEQLEQRVTELEKEAIKRKQAEEALRQRERKIRTLFENSPDIILEIDLEGKITYINHVAEGYTKEKVIGADARSFVPPEYLDYYDNVVNKVFKEGIQSDFEFTDANNRSFFASYIPIKDENQKVISAMVISTDITEREQAQEGIKRHAAQLATLHETGAAVSSHLILEEIFETVLKGLSEAFGYRLIGIYLIEEGIIELKAHVGYTSPPDPSLAHVPLEKGVIGRTARTGQPQLVPKVEEDPDFFDGAPGITSEVCVPLKSGDEILGVLNVESDKVGKPLDASDLQLLTVLSNYIVIAIENARLYDATQRELAERKLAEEAVQRTKKELETIVDSVPALVAYKDTSNRYIRINKTYAEAINLPRDHIEGKSAFDIASNREVAEAYWRDDKEVIASGVPKRNII